MNLLHTQKILKFIDTLVYYKLNEFHRISISVTLVVKKIKILGIYDILQVFHLMFHLKWCMDLLYTNLLQQRRCYSKLVKYLCTLDILTV